MKPFEITEEDEFINLSKSAQSDRIRRIIGYQKSLHHSASSSSASASSSSSHKRSSLLDKMKEGSKSLRRLFDMEHIPLSKHFNEYSGSPLTKPIYLFMVTYHEIPIDRW